MLKEPSRPLLALIATALAIVTIVILNLTLPEKLAHIMIGKNGPLGNFSVQNGMWIAFYIGLGEIYVRYRSARAQMTQLKKGYLPEDDKTVLQAQDLPPIYKVVRAVDPDEQGYLPRLISRCILQFQSSRSIDQSASLLNTSVEMFLHEVDLNYNMLRYLCWAIPSLGFIGTVIGIGLALSFAGDPTNADKANLLNEVTKRLAVSFDGTLVALVMASILVLLQNVVQSMEEHALNNSGQYCLDNLINRLYVAE
jgi:biopolymer transport protein ExbB/TolQ